MTLVATVALGLSLCQYSNALEETRRSQVVHDALYYNSTLKFINNHIIPYLIAGTIGYAVVRLQRPRAPWEQLARLPGTVAVTSIVLVLAWTSAWMAVHLAMGKSMPFVANPATFDDGVNPSWAVAGSWLTLLLTGRWHSDGYWLDRVGIGLGFARLGLLPLWHALPLLIR
jgi:hypothetical protein